MTPDEKIIMFRNRLSKVFRHLSKQADRLGISCYRIYDHDLPEFPFCIEKYDDKLYIAEYRRNHRMTEALQEEWMQKSMEVIIEILAIPASNVFLKLRQRKPGRLGQYQKLDGQKNEFVVDEYALKFIVNLSDYLDTGLFLDHRDTRKMIRGESKGKKVLNLFAYTGSFSLNAAAGDASEVVSVDLSNTYLDWARKNFQLNGYKENKKYQFIQADVLSYVRSKEAGRFDLILLDPPTFSNSKRMEDFLDIQRDHPVLINQCLGLLNENGILYFSTNSRKFVLEKGKINSPAIKDITRQTTPFDFQNRFSKWCYRIKK